MGTIITTNGATIRKSLTEYTGLMAGNLTLLAKDDTLPVDTKRNRRVAATTSVTEVIAEANAAFSAWVAKERDQALRALSQRPLGSAAEESRRVADELRLNRMIDSARRSGTPERAARDMAGQAATAYLNATGRDGHREAALLARAAVELGGSTQAREVLASAERQLETDEQREARKTLAALDVEAMIYKRDANAALASVLVKASEAAKAVNDPAAAALAQQAARASGNAKMMEFSLAQAEGRIYAEPTGALSGVPAEKAHATDNELANRVHNVTTGTVS